MLVDNSLETFLLEIEKLGFENVKLYKSPSRYDLVPNATIDGKGISSVTALRVGKTLEYVKPAFGPESHYVDWSMGDYYVVCFDKEEPGDYICLGPTKIEGYEIISTFKLYELPHCCAIVVSCNAWINEKYRGMGLGTLLNQLRQHIGRGLNYTTMLCTDVMANKAQRQILQKNGWKDIHQLKNKRTGNELAVSVIDL